MSISEQATCVTCEMPLVIHIESDSDDEDHDMAGSSSAPARSIDDDVHLQCGCHFHWQCLLDAYTLTECPHCKTSLVSHSSTGKEQVLCDLKNEGGVSEGIDILPILTEESYLKAYPEERKCRAFLEFCGSGDTAAILDMLGKQGDSEDEDMEDEVEGADQAKILRYQDHLGSMSSGLHLAIQKDRVETAWLLLFLASSLELSRFPPDLLSAAEAYNIERGDQAGREDIRRLKDSDGLTAEQRANSQGGIWTTWIREGVLRVE